jgi:hypothetical protein
MTRLARGLAKRAGATAAPGLDGCFFQTSSRSTRSPRHARCRQNATHSTATLTPTSSNTLASSITPSQLTYTPSQRCTLPKAVVDQPRIRHRARWSREERKLSCFAGSALFCGHDPLATLPAALPSEPNSFRPRSTPHTALEQHKTLPNPRTVFGQVASMLPVRSVQYLQFTSMHPPSLPSRRSFGEPYIL